MSEYRAARRELTGQQVQVKKVLIGEAPAGQGQETCTGPRKPCAAAWRASSQGGLQLAVLAQRGVVRRSGLWV
jgi:hypothetical protein